MANNPITVPLPQDLPETWAANQIVSPDGVSAGLTPQHGYNYLMQQVNNAQQAAQELGEAIAGLSGDNLPAGSDGGETISTALSNKVSRNGGVVPLGTNILTLRPGRYNVDGVTEDTWGKMNLPVLAWHYEIVVLAAEDHTGLINNYKVITVYPFGYIPEYIESYTNEMRYDGTWTGWAKNTTATPPQEYSLPLTEGFTPITPCTYRKNQFSEVFVGGSTGGTITDGTVIAILPEGFRPTNIVERPATFSVSGTQAAGSVMIKQNGNISAHGQSSASGVVFSANFVVDA